MVVALICRHSVVDLCRVESDVGMFRVQPVRLSRGCLFRHETEAGGV